jgi:uncharacterized protein
MKTFVRRTEMIRIKNIGNVAKTDLNGYILNETSWEKVNQNYQSAIHQVVDLVKIGFTHQLHSIYLRGSLPRGLGMEGVSDIDLLVVVYNSPEKRVIQDCVAEMEEKIGKKFPFVNGIEAGFITIEEVSDNAHFQMVPFMIKSYSIPLFGINLQEKLPQYKADEKLANEHIVNLQSQMEMALMDLEGNEDKEDIKDCCTWIMKIIIRCGMALVVAEENTYTRDLYPACQLFSRHYPGKEREMEEALHYAINPTEDSRRLTVFLKDRFGRWMIEEADRWLEKHNPSKQQHLLLT